MCFSSVVKATLFASPDQHHLYNLTDSYQAPSVRELATVLVLSEKVSETLYQVRAVSCRESEQMLITNAETSEGVGNTTKATGETGQGYINQATGKQSSGDNPLGL